MKPTHTPMIKQYLEIKNRHPNEILFFRLGDFYEMFFDDALLASRELEITLTGRDGGTPEKVPMCGVPYHAAEGYILKLIAKGYRVAICEQIEDPKTVKGIVKRDVIKIISPGTILSENAIVDTKNNFLVVVCSEEKSIGLSAIDITTGECFWALFDATATINDVCDQLFRLSPVEILWDKNLYERAELECFVGAHLRGCFCSEFPSENLALDNDVLACRFDGSEIPTAPAAIRAVEYGLAYVKYNLKTEMEHINRLICLNNKDYLVLDTVSLRNLEITRNIKDGGKKGTLLEILDFTKTAMGARLLKKWLEAPLLTVSDIVYRQQGITETFNNNILRNKIQEQLTTIYDFERIMTRIEIGTANARDLCSLKASLASIPAILNAMESSNSPILSHIKNNILAHEDIQALINATIVENPPFSIREGGIINQGISEDLDELRELARDSRRWIQQLEAKEREETGIRSLKVGYNKVFGYYIEVTHANTESVPLRYIRKQTLANAERYITPELKEFEIKVLGAQEKIVVLEYQLFCQIRDKVSEQLCAIQETARQIAVLDCLISLAEAAVRYNYICPEINDKREINILDSRHPVVERFLKDERFVPNDVVLNHKDTEIAIITGPNMAGKSTYMRQVALLVLMAQIGSYIPARQAVISPVDRIFTRIGASDDLTTGQSTFMLEMNEVAAILKYATADSLIILDEIGRGTSTFDGMSIARAVIEYIKETIRAKTLFATHYHELTDLADEFLKIKNFTVAVKERGREVVFLRRIIAGGADKSYGIHVAQLAGLPKKIINRSYDILEGMEKNHGMIADTSGVENIVSSEPMVSLFSSAIIEEIAGLDIPSLTPIESLNILWRLNKQAKDEVDR